MLLVLGTVRINHIGLLQLREILAAQALIRLPISAGMRYSYFVLVLFEAIHFIAAVPWRGSDVLASYALE